MGSRSAYGMGYTGYPARIFFEMTNYGRGTQTHLEKMVILEKWYSHLRAYLPVRYEDKKKTEEFKEKVLPLLIDVYKEIEEMNIAYRPGFEGDKKCDDEEKDFTKIMRGVFERLDQITAMSKVIEGQRLDEMEVQVG